MLLRLDEYAEKIFTTSGSVNSMRLLNAAFAFRGYRESQNDPSPQ